nr:integrase, catalytic region, zinc finger, CCHC-type, peptidase aspartic, catalytic [Tanacetum cinerariifolium]
MILESVKHDPLLWPTIEENGVTRPSKYSELTPAEAIQADYDVKATNIILQGLPQEVYALKAQQLEPKLYDGNVIKSTSAIVIPDFEEILMLAKESHSKMLLKQQDLMVLEKKINTTPIDYAVLNQNSMNSSYHSPSCRPIKVEVPKELPKVSMKFKEKSWKPTGKVFTQTRYTWRPNGRTFTIVGNACPLTRITTTTEVPLWKPTILENNTPKPVVKLVYSRKPRKSKTNVPVSKAKIIKSISANNKEPNKSWGSIVSDVPSSSIDECSLSKLFSVKFGNDHVAKIMGYGDYQIGNITISWVYYLEGLGHNLIFVGQLWDSNLEVAFRQHTCFIRNQEGDDLLTGSHGNNLYILSIEDMMASSPIYLLSNASKTKSWL